MRSFLRELRGGQNQGHVALFSNYGVVYDMEVFEQLLPLLREARKHLVLSQDFSFGSHISLVGYVWGASNS
jgi:hypothetical protein